MFIVFDVRYCTLCDIFIPLISSHVQSVAFFLSHSYSISRRVFSSFARYFFISAQFVAFVVSFHMCHVGFVSIELRVRAYDARKKKYLLFIKLSSCTFFSFRRERKMLPPSLPSSKSTSLTVENHLNSALGNRFCVDLHLFCKQITAIWNSICRSHWVKWMSCSWEDANARPFELCEIFCAVCYYANRKRVQRNHKS